MIPEELDEKISEVKSKVDFESIDQSIASRDASSTVTKLHSSTVAFGLVSHVLFV